MVRWNGIFRLLKLHTQMAALNWRSNGSLWATDDELDLSFEMLSLNNLLKFVGCIWKSTNISGNIYKQSSVKDFLPLALVGTHFQEIESQMKDECSLQKLPTTPQQHLQDPSPAKTYIYIYTHRLITLPKPPLCYLKYREKDTQTHVILFPFFPTFYKTKNYFLVLYSSWVTKRTPHVCSEKYCKLPSSTD